MKIELTRRDALVALAVAGAGIGTGLAVLENRSDESPAPPATDEPRATLTGHDRETVVAVARVVYPSAVSGIEEFVTTFLEGRTDREGFVRGLSTAVSDLDTRGVDWFGGRFVDLAPTDQDRLLREVGADTAEADPNGTTAERVRYFLVNEVLFALYASPTGGRLVGIENPQGHPGGIQSYQRGPNG